MLLPLRLKIETPQRSFDCLQCSAASRPTQDREEEGVRPDGREEALQGGVHPRGAERPAPAPRGGPGPLLRAAPCRGSRRVGAQRQRGAVHGAPGGGRGGRRGRRLERGPRTAGAPYPRRAEEAAGEPEAGPGRRRRRRRPAPGGEEQQRGQPEQPAVTVVTVAQDLRQAVGRRRREGPRGLPRWKGVVGHVRELAEPAVVGEAPRVQVVQLVVEEPAILGLLGLPAGWPAAAEAVQRWKEEPGPNPREGS